MGVYMKQVEYYVQDCRLRVVARTSRSGGSDSSAVGMLTATPIHSTREASSCESFLPCPARLPKSCVRIHDLRPSGPRPRVVHRKNSRVMFASCSALKRFAQAFRAAN